MRQTDEIKQIKNHNALFRIDTTPLDEANKKAKKAINIKITIFRLIKYIFLTALAVFFLFPFFILVLKAFMTRAESIDVPIVIFPSKFVLDGFSAAFSNGFLNELKNTLILVVANCIAIPLSSSLCAYGFSKCRFKGKEMWFAITLATIMLPSIVVQIPVYVMFIRFGWMNTFYPMIIPSFLGGGAVNIFLIRQFMLSLPRDLNEAAKIDGANEFFVYFTIVMPLCLPVIMLVIVNTFIGTWNDFMGPLLYLRKEEMYTLGLGIYHRFPPVTNNQVTYPNEQMAAGLLMTIPPAILFFIFQKQLIEGIALSGIKG